MPMDYDDIDALYQIKTRMEPILQKLLSAKDGEPNTESEKTKDFMNIFNSILKYLEQHCNHEYVDDYIDTSPDAGMNIRYCKFCYREPR
jgi:hypothetical protein